MRAWTALCCALWVALCVGVSSAGPSLRAHSQPRTMQEVTVDIDGTESTLRWDGRVKTVGTIQQFDFPGVAVTIGVTGVSEIVRCVVVLLDAETCCKLFF